jgi:hypothetical protein
MIKMVLDETQERGEYTTPLGGSQLDPGIYFVVISTNQFIHSKKIVKI